MRSFDCTSYRVYFGKICEGLPTVRAAVKQQGDGGFDFFLVPIRLRDSSQFDDLIDIRGVPSETMSASVAGISDFHSLPIDIADSSRFKLQSELSWAAHAGMYACLIRFDASRLELLSQSLATWYRDHPQDTTVTRIWIELGIEEWDLWDQLRRTLNHPRRLSVCLRLDNHPVERNVYDRWLGEPVASFIFPDIPMDSTTLLFGSMLVKINAQPIALNSSQVEAFSKYLSSCDPLSWEESYISPYYDMLQLPLQPLADNMENSIYETFEFDRTKYDLYEEAVHEAITSLLKDYPEETVVRIAVVGAGRGGLINACVRAINRISSGSVRFSIIGVEKNPNAARTLKYKARDEELWHSNDRVSIEIVESDMRSWKPMNTIDILVSELLGSLSDNEASPECIDGVMHVLDPLRGVSIPKRYFSSLQPVSCERAWVSARDSQKLEHILVTALHNCYRVGSPELLFEFVHEPGPASSPPSNEREKTISWPTGDVDVTIHGFIGYFHADLSRSVVLSTHPPTKSQGMVSWFPAFLPLKTPVLVHAGQTITATVRRRVADGKRMWFEWTVENNRSQKTNNIDGSMYCIGL